MMISPSHRFKLTKEYFEIWDVFAYIQATAISGFGSAFTLMTYAIIHTTSFRHRKPTQTLVGCFKNCQQVFVFKGLQKCVCVYTRKCFYAAQEFIPQAQIPYLI